ncbi:MAG: trafficking protein particle complex 2 [Benniella sp.]|nr:MAG: trafficking protein particle complex 2 [Benniella sp.]
MTNINICCIAIIGKQNNPLYIKNFNSSQPDLKYHYIAHTSCDVIEERAVNKTQEMYLGTLFSMEDLAVYGYMTNTKIKFITVLNMPDVTIKDLDMKNVFRRIHAAYVSHACNPFYDIDSQKMIKSKKFEEEIEAIGIGRALEGGNRNSHPHGL